MAIQFARRTFAPGKCHHRDDEGKPDCRKPTAFASANLCRTHEDEYRAGNYLALKTGYGGTRTSRRSPSARARRGGATRSPRRKPAS